MGGDQGGAGDPRGLDSRHRAARSATVFDTWRKRPVAKEEVTQDVGNARLALDGSAKRIKATYNVAVQTHATIGPSCAVADFKGALTIWTSSQATHSMQQEVAVITGLPREAIRLVFIKERFYGRNGTEDAAANAALISMLIRQPVRVQWSQQESRRHARLRALRVRLTWRPASTRKETSSASTSELRSSTTSPRSSHSTSRCSRRPRPAFRSPAVRIRFLFQRPGQPYEFPEHIRVNTRHIAEAFFRSSHLRSPGRIENSYANEGFMDELAAAANADPATPPIPISARSTFSRRR